MSLDLAAVRAAVEAVPDPELPPVTLGMLGMVLDVSADGRGVRVELVPTFAGCPAQEMMATDVTAAVAAVAGTGTVEVVWRLDQPWSADRISAAGHVALRAFGIAPPEGRRRLPVVLASDEDTAEDARTCPWCGSQQTQRDALFGPTPCRDVRWCRDCRQPFEAFRT